MKGTVKRAWKEVAGGVLNQALTTSWNDGDPMIVEAATEFDPAGGDAIIEPGHPTKEEVISYSGALIAQSESGYDYLLGVQRQNRKAHSAGVFIQEGLIETATKHVDILVGGELLSGVPVDTSAYTYIRLGTFDDDNAPVVPVEFDNGEGFCRVTGPPAGAVPLVGSDPETVLPPDQLPPPSGKKPAAPTGFALTPRNSVNPDGTYTHYIDAVYAHSGLYEDGTDVTGLHFRADIYDGSTKRWVIEAGSSLSFTQQVDGNKSYDAELYALDFANTESDPALDSVSTSPDSTAPATPTGLALVGGVGGGGLAIIYAQWTPNTEIDFDHYEVHASTVASSFTPSASTLIANTAATNHPISNAYNGSVKTTFSYTTTVHVKLKAVDRSTNASAATTAVSATGEEAASADITDIQSDNFSTGVSGWRFTKAGNLEANNGTFRGSLVANTIVSMSSSGGGVVITGSTNEIALGSGLKLDGDGNGSVTFGSNCSISGASAGAVNIGTEITLDGTGVGTIIAGGVTIDGDGSITVGASGPVILTNSSIQWNDKGTIAESGAFGLHIRASSGYNVTLSTVSGLIALNDDVVVQAGSSIHIGADTNHTGNFLSFRNTAGTPSAPTSGRAVIFYDAASGASGAIKARNPVSTITLGAF